MTSLGNRRRAALLKTDDDVGACVPRNIDPDCSVCSEGCMASVGFTCVDCSGRTHGIVFIVAMAVMAGLVIPTVVLYLVSSKANGTKNRVLDGARRYVPLQSVKIVIVAWQILTQVRREGRVVLQAIRNVCSYVFTGTYDATACTGTDSRSQ